MCELRPVLEISKERRRDDNRECKMMKRHDMRKDQRRSRTRRFFENQFGSATIEFVIWLPWFFMLLMLTVDASFMYMSLTRMENAARDAARRVAVGQFDKDEIIIYALGQLPDLKYDVYAGCSPPAYACVC